MEHMLHLHYKTTGCAGSAPAGAAGGGHSLESKEEARMREVIEGEVLDMRPSVGWKDIAGLAGAKQVIKQYCSGSVVLPSSAKQFNTTSKYFA